MTSTYALVECIHESHTEHPLIITLHYFIKSWNLLQSNNKTQSARKVQSEPHWVMQRPQGSTKEYIPQPILITAARRSKRSHGEKAARKENHRIHRLHVRRVA
ncbi:hypothetical protein EAO08_32210 [Klebsiella pneumoniae]|nr:hypothetical protein EAO08_32210 [Klebsiella pneumoniae]